MKTQILFVDDDPFLLQAQRRLLRRVKHWDTSFAESGAAALELAKMTCFDVVVSDMRMPNMNGIQLLQEIREVTPGAVRIILSGQTDDEVVYRAFGPAQRHLAKPCDVTDLRANVEASVRLHDVLSNPSAHAIVRQSEVAKNISDHRRLVLEGLQTRDANFDWLLQVIDADSVDATILKQLMSGFTASDPTNSLRGMTAHTQWDTTRPLVLSAYVLGHMLGNDEAYRTHECRIESAIASAIKTRGRMLDEMGVVAADKYTAATMIRCLGDIAADNLGISTSDPELSDTLPIVAAISAEQMGICHTIVEIVAGCETGAGRHMVARS
jgi:CheY-like chemotaxis protein